MNMDICDKTISGRAVLLVCLFLTCLVSCGREMEEGLDLSVDKPEQIIEKFSMTDRRAGKKLWELIADKAQIFEDGGVVFLEKPLVHFYEEGKKSSTVSAESGKVNRQDKLMELWGDVVINSLEDKTVIKTERMFYDTGDERIFSEEAVEITRPGMVTRGVGFESDVGLNVIEIKNNITEIEDVGDEK